MSIFKDGKEIVEIYKGDKEISEIYHGDKLIFSKLKPGTVLFESSTPQETTIQVPRAGLYQIICVGGGGGGCWSVAGLPIMGYSSSGGSSGGFNIIAYLRKDSYNVKIGAGGNVKMDTSGNPVFGGTGENSYLGSFIAYGGGGGSASGGSGAGGVGGQLSILSNNVYDVTFNKPGNNGSSNGGILPSTGSTPGVYLSYGYGGDSSGQGGSGYVFLKYVKTHTKIARSLTFNIDVPADIEIDGETVATGVTTYNHTMTYGDTINYEISASGYVTETDSYTWDSGDTTDTLTITMTPE